MGDRIELRGLRQMVVCGVLDHEQAQAQPFEFDIDLHVDLLPAMSDDLDDTVNYGEVLERIDQGGDAVNADAISEHGDAADDDDDDIFDSADGVADAAIAPSDGRDAAHAAGGLPSASTSVPPASTSQQHGLPAAQAPPPPARRVVKVDPTDLYSALDDD